MTDNNDRLIKVVKETIREYDDNGKVVRAVNTVTEEFCSVTMYAAQPYNPYYSYTPSNINTFQVAPAVVGDTKSDGSKDDEN